MKTNTPKKVRELYEPLIACYETEDGVMNLQFDTVKVKLSKRHFVEFSVIVHKLGKIIIDEMVEEKINESNPLHLEA